MKNQIVIIWNHLNQNSYRYLFFTFNYNKNNFALIWVTLHFCGIQIWYSQSRMLLLVALKFWPVKSLLIGLTNPFETLPQYGFSPMTETRQRILLVLTWFCWFPPKYHSSCKWCYLFAVPKSISNLFCCLIDWGDYYLAWKQVVVLLLLRFHAQGKTGFCLLSNVSRPHCPPELSAFTHI